MSDPAIDFDPDLDPALAQVIQRIEEIPKLVAKVRDMFPDRPGMPEWFRIARKCADELEKLNEWRQLYSGDILTLNGEVDRFREELQTRNEEVDKLQAECDDLNQAYIEAEKYVLQLENRLEAISELVLDAVPWKSAKVKA